MINKVKKTTSKRGLIGQVKSALTKPKTYVLAVRILRLIVWVARVFDLFR